MKCLERNKKDFYYALFLSKEDILDEYGNKTGEYKIIYDIPVHIKANISNASGRAQADQFGTAITYDRVIVVDDINCPIDEYSVLCIDKQPTYDENNNLVFDYIVKKRAESLNSISYAIAKVKVS